ncbi:MAG: carboxypeptidase-like regulatory domain-containing protein [bacterium]
MKKKNLFLSALLFFSILPISLFTSCDKDTNSYLEVTVVDETYVDPISGIEIANMPIPGAAVTVYQDGGHVYAAGITDGSGSYSTHFVAPAIVKIKAVIQLYTQGENPQPNGQRRGETSVRLVEGETVSAKVTVPFQVFYDTPDQQ